MNNNKDNNNLFYGPIISRRFGFSLGIDVIPYKICSYDCIYCQLGRTRTITVDRKIYKEINIDCYNEQLIKNIGTVKNLDFITFSGSGEPTLHKDLGFMIERTKKITGIPVLVLTNGSLLYREDVRTDLYKADAVKVSMDAANSIDYRKINRPHRSLVFRKVIEGLTVFLENFEGSLFLEIMLINGINDDLKKVDEYRKIIEKLENIRPLTAIHLNTPVRIPAENAVNPPESEKIAQIKLKLSGKAQIIGDSNLKGMLIIDDNLADSIIRFIRVRPANLENISSTFGIHANEALKILNELVKKSIIKYRFYNGDNYYYR
jgi:wyosine [tRNA(Phe)-imidazoG37] synthetase (radical SAM superfamily)